MSDRGESIWETHIGGRLLEIRSCGSIWQTFYSFATNSHQLALGIRRHYYRLRAKSSRLLIAILEPKSRFLAKTITDQLSKLVSSKGFTALQHYIFINSTLMDVMANAFCPATNQTESLPSTVAICDIQKRAQPNLFHNNSCSLFMKHFAKRSKDDLLTQYYVVNPFVRSFDNQPLFERSSAGRSSTRYMSFGRYLLC